MIEGGKEGMIEGGNEGIRCRDIMSYMKVVLLLSFQRQTTAMPLPIRLEFWWWMSICSVHRRKRTSPRLYCYRIQFDPAPRDGNEEEYFNNTQFL